MSSWRFATTTLKCLMGFIADKSGSIQFEGAQIIRCLPEEIARLGRAYCPEDRGIFSQLSVLENLTLPPVIHADGLTLKVQEMRTSASGCGAT